MPIIESPTLGVIRVYRHPVAFEKNILNATKDIFWDKTLARKYLVFQEKTTKSQQKGDGNTSMGVFPPVEIGAYTFQGTIAK